MDLLTGDFEFVSRKIKSAHDPRVLVGGGEERCKNPHVARNQLLISSTLLDFRIGVRYSFHGKVNSQSQDL